MVRSTDDGHLVADRYRLHEQLDAGVTGSVRRGEDVVLGRDVLVRDVTFPVEVPGTDPAVLREQTGRAARALAQLDHPGAVPVLDVVDDGAATHVVLRDVPGTRLSEVVTRDGPLSPQRTALVGLAVLGVLRAAHAHGLLHRDVTPANVLLSAQGDASPGRVFLTDFGIAQSVGDAALAGTGLVIGSPGYTAPELARGEPPGPASDLWSLGATLFTTVEGRPPYEGDDAAGTLAAVVSGEQAPYLRAGPLQPVLERLLDRDPARRPTPEELEVALGEAAASWAGAGTAPLLPPPAAVVPDVVVRPAVLDVGTPGPVDRRAVPPAGVHRAARTPTSHRAPVRRRRRATWPLRVGLLLAGLLAVVLALLWAGRGPSTDVAAERPAATEEAPATEPPAETGTAPVTSGTTLLPALPATAATPGERLRLTIPALAEAAERTPDAVGPRAGAVLEDLRRIESLEGAEQRSAAIAADAAVAEAVLAGELDDGVGQRVQQVLDDVVRPERLVDLVAMLDVDPLAVGPGGPEVFEQLFALDHRVPADQTAARAADALQAVTAGTDQGRLSEAFERAAVPTLLELADPAPHRALVDLLARAEEDPAAVGPAPDDVLAALRSMQTLPVFELGNQAAVLLELVERDGQVTPAFRDAAVTVLPPLVR
ncbi:serine/threonine-protein kinase [Geodermatophilus maliterrae]|uniref:non-specific serine/threonine protein kinase n=1 Tax=Geodermatophilus maliterrae TaxID=3162531 RepID=A0ABV3XLU4_9ACTN